LEEVERDPETRQRIQLIRNEEAISKLSKEELERITKPGKEEKQNRRNVVKVKNVKQAVSHN